MESVSISENDSLSVVLFEDSIMMRIESDEEVKTKYSADHIYDASHIEETITYSQNVREYRVTNRYRDPITK